AALHGVGPAGPAIGGSQIEARADGGVRVSIQGRSAPFLAGLTGGGGRGEGGLGLGPLCREMSQAPPDGGGLHRWQVVVPRGRVGVRFSRPDFAFDGVGYHDVNEGDGRLETAFSRWSWARFHEGDRTVVLYAARERAGGARALVVDARDAD